MRWLTKFGGVSGVLLGAACATGGEPKPRVPPPAATLTLSAPLDHQVVQRATATTGFIPIRGQLSGVELSNAALEARVVAGERTSPWQRLSVALEGAVLVSHLASPAGGWHRVEVRVLDGRQVVAETQVARVGVGEVFVVAGQSNSANHGAQKQSTRTGRVAVFDGAVWQQANDPQPGASGRGGSFMPPLGDLLAERFNVPIGFIACGVGATSVREWLPKGATFPNPPTIERRVQLRPDGQWESKGEAFDTLVGRMKDFGRHGFRAVLWHQGESDANQKDPTRTYPGPLYQESLKTVIRESRRAIGWDAPWFVAQVSYHGPDDEGSPEIRAAQASLWADGLSLEGPDSDALRGEWRERAGQGVHFSGPGLREHAARWMQKIAPWLEAQLQ